MYRLVVAVMDPHLWLHLILAAALVRLCLTAKSKRRTVWFAATAYLLLALVSTPVVAFLAAATLERDYPPKSVVPHISKIVVLGGGVRENAGGGRSWRLAPDSYERCLRAYFLHLEHPSATIIASGGKVDGKRPGPPLGEALKSVLCDLGVPADAVVVESESQNTFENAVNVRKLIGASSDGSVALVTTAIHLPRAVSCFRAQGIRVVPVGIGYQATKFSPHPLAFLPQTRAADSIRRVVHEWLGIVWYKLRSRI